MHNKPHSKETKEKLREIALKLKLCPPSRKGSKWSEEQTEKMKKTMKGRKITWGDKISEAKVGKKIKPMSEETKRKISEALDGDKSSNWKGEDVGYSGLHKWVYKHLGRPTKCEDCGRDGLTGQQIDWANKDHKYRRNLDDWIRLCHSCHRKYDYENNLYKK